jgi:hypothetical protein
MQAGSLLVTANVGVSALIYSNLNMEAMCSSETSVLTGMSSSVMLCRVARATTDVSEERSASIIRVRRIGELGTTC